MDDSHYEPTPEEQKELDDLIAHEQELEALEKKKKKFDDRKFFEFQTESHWAGWLRIHGIRWD